MAWFSAVRLRFLHTQRALSTLVLAKAVSYSGEMAAGGLTRQA